MISINSQYKLLDEIGNGSFGQVFLAISRSSNDKVAVKKMKQTFQRWEECINLREVKALKKLTNHENIIKLRQVIRENDGSLFFVFDYMERNLYQLIKERKGELFKLEDSKRMM